MAKNEDLDLGPEFDDDECIEFILNLIPEEDKQGLSEDDVQYVLDTIYEFYETEGLIDEEVATDGYVDETKQLDFVRKAVKKAGLTISDTQIQLILDGEFEYGLEKGFYEEDEE